MDEIAILDKMMVPANRISIKSSSGFDLEGVLNPWDRLLLAFRKYKGQDFENRSFEAEFIPSTGKTAYANFYLDGKKIFHGNLLLQGTEVSMHLYEDYNSHRLVDYKYALLAISDISKKIGIRELGVNIQDSECYAPTARLLQRTMQAIGLKCEVSRCGDFSHETYFCTKTKELPEYTLPTKLEERVAQN